MTRDGRKTRARTKTSCSLRDVPDILIGQMAEPCKLSRGAFLELVDCPPSRDHYEALLAEQGEI